MLCNSDNVYISVLSNMRDQSFTMDLFYSDLDQASVEKFIKKYCVMCDKYFTSSHELSVHRHYPKTIFSGIDLSKMPADF